MTFKLIFCFTIISLFTICSAMEEGVNLPKDREIKEYPTPAPFFLSEFGKLRIALINVPLKNSTDGSWISIPPQGYGGIQWVVTNLLDGYLELGHKVWLLGAPTSSISNTNLQIVEVAEPLEIYKWLNMQVKPLKIDVIHDHSNAIFNPQLHQFDCPIVSTHHLTGKPKGGDYHIYLSSAQREQAGEQSSEIIRIPVNPKYYTYSTEKKNYLLYLGRVSPWKGAYEAANFANASHMDLIIAGPSWEKDYFDKIITSYAHCIKYQGEVGGEIRKKLLTEAKAVLALSQSVLGPWGDTWCEPGSTVVSEAAISGTPVISSSNGCLKEIVPLVGKVLPENMDFTPKSCLEALNLLPSSDEVHQKALQEWGHLKISQQYINLFNWIRLPFLEYLPQDILSKITSYLSSKDQLNFSHLNTTFYSKISNRTNTKLVKINDFRGITEKLYTYGGVIVPSILTAQDLQEVDQVSKELIKKWHQGHIQDPDFWSFTKAGKTILYRIHNLEKKHQAFKNIASHPLLLKLREHIFRQKSKATAYALSYKSPFGSGEVPWHRDPINVPTSTVFNFSIFLDSSDHTNGTLEILPGSHHTSVPYKRKPKYALPLPASLGDIIIHDVNVYHGSSNPFSHQMRRSLLIEFQPDKGEEK